MFFEYKVGGSLPRNAPSYVNRPADDELYHALLDSDFCYVLNSRQMGKSSLRVRTMHRLEEIGVACCAIDLTQIGSKQPTSDEWYSGIIRNLVRSFGLAKKVDLRAWLRERDCISVVQKLSEFIEDVVLVEVSQQIVIFIDEIDSVISLDFSTDDFFAIIRAFYNERAYKPEYKRIAFCLLGVATPSDLIKDIKRTPFNIGKAIALQGLPYENALPLVEGLTGIVDNPQAAVKTVLSQTGGQPFLTQKVCQLILDDQGNLSIEELIQTYIIDNWETQDNPEHLRTIRSRILKNEEQAVRSLGLYQQILNHNVETRNFASPSGANFASPSGANFASPSPGEVNDTIELRLSGLVVQHQGKLQPYNRIYQEVFNLEWVAKALANLRPYAVTLSAWLASGSKDASLLLQGQKLDEALVWASTRNLSDDDYRYISASQQLDRLEASKAAQARLAEVKKRTHRQMVIGGTILGLSLLGAVGLGIYTEQARQKAFAAIQLEQDGAYAMQEFNYRQLPGLLTAMRTGQSLKKMLPQSYSIIDYPALSPVLSLQDILASIQEKNTLEDSSPVSSVAISSDGKTIVKDFQQAQQLNAKVDLEPDIEGLQNNAEETAKKQTILALISKAKEYLKQNNFNQAVTVYTDITKLQPSQKALAYSWDSLCWEGSLDGFAKNVVKDACEKAVSLAPSDNNMRDSRGLAKALTGDTKGAIADFEAFIKSGQDAQQKAQRQSWVKELQAGKNPFTQQELEELRK